MNEQDLCFLDIAALGRLYRGRALSPVEATRAALGRLARLDGGLNSFITVLEDAAMAQARRAEAELARGRDRGPLHGVPISLKDLIDTAGVPTTAGSRRWRERVPAQSATVATRLERAGAVLLGKTNLLEFAYGIVHPDFGQTNNPWDMGRTAGGSSGGSAASVAAGIGYGSIGSDTGGSIRIPASYCGVVGLKPTYGLVSLAGVCPLSPSLDHLGPIARSAADAAALLQAIAGPDPADPLCLPDPPADYLGGLGGELRGLRVGVVAEHFARLRPGVAEPTWAALRTLQALGIELREIRMPALEGAEAALLALVMPEASLIHAADMRDHPGDYAPLTLAQLGQGAQIPAVDYLRAQEYRRGLRAAMLAALGDVDLLAGPTVAWEAPADVDLLAGPTVAWEAPAEDPPVGDPAGADEALRTGPYNLTGLPAISIPCGRGPSGLPLGLQLAAPPLAEPLLLRVAHQYERAAGARGRVL